MAAKVTVIGVIGSAPRSFTTQPARNLLILGLVLLSSTARKFQLATGRWCTGK